METDPSERIPWTTLREVVRVALGEDGPDAELASEALVEAQALGLPHFGVGLLQRWRTEGREVRLTSADNRTGHVQHWDVEGMFGPLALARASRVTTVEAKASGIGVVVLHGLGGSGRLAPFAQAIAANGMVGVVLAASPPLVAAHGGHTPLWGTNPFALAVPGQDTPLVVDASTATITAGSLADARLSGSALPDGAAVNAHGDPVDNPADVAALLPRGGLMGTLTAVLVESLTSGLAGQSSTSDWRAATVMAFEARAPVADEMRQRIEAAEAHEPGAGTRHVLSEARRCGVSLPPASRTFLGMT